MQCGFHLAVVLLTGGTDRCCAIVIPQDAHMTIDSAGPFPQTLSFCCSRVSWTSNVCRLFFEKPSRHGCVLEVEIGIRPAQQMTASLDGRMTS